MTTQRLIDALTRLSLDQPIGDELRGSRAGAAAAKHLGRNNHQIRLRKSETSSKLGSHVSK